MVSVDFQHHVYLHDLHTPFPPSLISLMVSVDVKHRVYLLTDKTDAGKTELNRLRRQNGTPYQNDCATAARDK